MSTRGKHRADAARELDFFAIAEQFAAEHASGANPRLADYLRRYPKHATELTAFVTALLSETEPEEAAADEDPRTSPLAPGTLRALQHLFPDPDTELPAPAVAESRAEYQAGYQAGEPAGERAHGLLALARERQLTADALANAVHLSPALIRWLDGGELASATIPAPLVEQLAAALSVPRNEVLASLRVTSQHGEAEAAPPAGRFREALLGDTTLAKVHLIEWLALLDEHA